MFDKNTSSTTTAVTIRRVRNGFTLTEEYRPERLISTEPYVFTELKDLYDFLIDNDFEITEE